MQFFNYVMRKTWLHQTRIGLALYDVAGQGFLRESVSIRCLRKDDGMTVSISNVIYPFEMLLRKCRPYYSKI